MNIMAKLEQHLAWRLFLSYLLILVIGVVVLDTVAELQSPAGLARNTLLQSFEASNPGALSVLEANFQAIVHEHLIIASLVGILAAIAASFFVTRRIVTPIREMMQASQRIAAGDYHVRIDPPSRDELGALAESLNQMAQALDEAEHRRIELIGDVAHELRTPLTNLKSSLEGMIDEVIPHEPETFLTLQREVSRMQHLVNDLQELSRAEAGQISLEIRPTALQELIHAVAEKLRPQFEDKQVVLDVQIPPNLSCAQADSNRSTQVLINLLGNALQYTPSGGSVTVRASQERREILVSIQDTGIGIASDQLPHIFERFYRVDKSRSRAAGGSGIGLTIAKHLVEAQGGRIWASSPGPGKGTTCTFTLPVSA